MHIQITWCIALFYVLPLRWFARNMKQRLAEEKRLGTSELLCYLRPRQKTRPNAAESVTCLPTVPLMIFRMPWTDLFLWTRPVLKNSWIFWESPKNPLCDTFGQWENEALGWWKPIEKCQHRIKGVKTPPPWPLARINEWSREFCKMIQRKDDLHELIHVSIYILAFLPNSDHKTC